MEAVLDLREPSRLQRPDLSALAQELFPHARATWRARMQNEYASSAVFEALALQLERAAFDVRFVSECRQFAAEERRHGILCGAVVEALGGEALATLPEQPPFPHHADASPRAAALRNLIHVCCMSETVAVALIGAERLEMTPGGDLFDLLTQIYADEVGHARFGWRVLETVANDLNDEDREAIERYLPVAFAHLRDHELSHLPNVDAPEGGACLGLCSGRDARVLLHETIAEVIRPGLARWFRCQFSPV